MTAKKGEDPGLEPPSPRSRRRRAEGGTERCGSPESDRQFLTVCEIPFVFLLVLRLDATGRSMSAVGAIVGRYTALSVVSHDASRCDGRLASAIRRAPKGGVQLRGVSEIFGLERLM
jgi:hypothetical protein